MKRFSTLIFKCTVIAVIVWLLGQFISDRWLWSQWLSWIPTFALLVLLFLSTLLYLFRFSPRIFVTGE